MISDQSLRAHIIPADLTEGATATLVIRGLGGHAIVHLVILYPRTHLNDLPAEFVADDNRQIHGDADMLMKDVDIRATDPGPPHPDLHLAGTWMRFGPIHELDIPIPLFRLDNRLHARSPILPLPSPTPGSFFLLTLVCLFAFTKHGILDFSQLKKDGILQLDLVVPDDLPLLDRPLQASSMG